MDENGLKGSSNGTFRIAQPPVQYVQHEYHSVRGKNPRKNTIRKSQKKVSAFILKLFNMLHDPSLASLIWWSRLDQDDAATFALVPGSQFSQCLSVYFKHSNVASFVRQLHMYGFHKVSDLPINAPGTSHSIWEFRHSLGQFKRGDADSLQRIKRRNNNKKQHTDDVEVDLSSHEQQQQQQPLQQLHPVQYQLTPQHHQPTPQHHHVYSPQPPLIHHPHHQQQQQQQQQQQMHMNYPPQRLYSPTGIRQQPQQQQQLPPQIARNYSPQHVNPTFSDNVFFNYPSNRNRYPSVLVDPCAPPISNSLPIDEQHARYDLQYPPPPPLSDPLRSRSEPQMFPQSQQQLVNQRIQNEHRSLPHLQNLPHPPLPHPLQQLRPSIFAVHQQQQFQNMNNYQNKHFNSSITSTITHDSIFSNKLSIASSNGGSISAPVTMNKHSVNPIGNLLNSDSSSLPEDKRTESSESEISNEVDQKDNRVSPSDIALKQ